MPAARRALATLSCLGFLACGGGGGSTPGGGGANLTITPAAPRLNPGERFIFDATLNGTSGAVTWNVVELGGGYQETLGNLETLYTAPAAPGTYHLAAQGPGGASGQATITVLSPAEAISVSLSPASATLQPGQALAFTATVANDTNQTVGWAVAEAGGGVVDAAGAYTAPSTPGLYHLVAWSQDDDAATAEAAILVGPASAPASLLVRPTAADVAPGRQQAFAATLFHAAGPVTWSVLEAGGGSISGAGLYTAPSTPGLYHVRAAAGALATDIPVTVVAPVTTRAPRIWLDATALAQVRARAAAATPAWQALKARCDTYLAGPVNLPDGNGYPDTGVGQGYQGSDYYEAVLDLGLAYQALRLSDPASANAYAAKGVEVLMAMSDLGPHAQPPSTDDGYGIRFYGAGMAIGFDWLHDQLGASQRQQVLTAMGNWIAFFEQSGFENGIPPGIANPPNGNYFAGYYAAKALAALAAEGEDPEAPARWTDWLDRVHGRMVQPDYALYMAGGGAPEGWNYSPFATKNMITPTLAAKTAKGLDLVNDPARPFAFPFDQGPYLLHFTWPTRLTLDDRGTLYNSDNPAATQVGLSTALAYLQGALGAPSAPYVHRYAREIRTLQGNDRSFGLWEDLLYWDDAAPEADYTTLPLSYQARGNGEVAMRASWATDAVWASFRAAPYIANGGGGHEYFDQGGLAIVRGGTPFLVNSTGEFERNTPGTANGGTWDDTIYTNLFGTKVRDIFNVFYVKTPTGDYGQAAYDPTVAATALTHVEDGGGYVRMRGEKLEELYRPGGPEPAGGGAVVAWTRDVVYLRPQLFVVYDRTQAASASADQWMAWHFGKIPAEGAAPQAGTHRWDITYNGTYAGAMTTLLPAGNATSLVDVFGGGKVYRVEVRPGAAAATQRWLTVLDAAATSTDAEKATRLSAADGNVSAGAVQGVLLEGSASNQAVLFGTGDPGTAVSGTLAFTVPAAATTLVLTDLPGATGYTVTASLAAGKLTVQAAPGSGFTTSANGTLYLSLGATGTVSAGP
ncbi:MAG TPA: hypothetical protein VJ600_06915 [Holophagaceae bacterium]|nr:hypothetical protein [Holophagaceae bacterium]